eukprot:scaffold180132_cov40-Tisochrysis_lutea.AAC.1
MESDVSCIQTTANSPVHQQKNAMRLALNQRNAQVQVPGAAKASVLIMNTGKSRKKKKIMAVDITTSPGVNACIARDALGRPMIPPLPTFDRHQTLMFTSRLGQHVTANASALA